MARFQTLREWAAELGFTQAFLCDCIRRGELRAVFNGGRKGYCVDSKDIEAWLEARKKAGPQLSNREKSEIKRQAGVV